MFASISNLLHRRRRGKESETPKQQVPHLPGLASDDTPLAPPVGPRRGSSEQDVLVRPAAGVSFEPLPAPLQAVPDEPGVRPQINVAFDERDAAPIFDLIDRFAADDRLNAATALQAVHLLDAACAAKCRAVDEQEDQIVGLAGEVVAARQRSYERLRERLQSIEEELRLLDVEVDRLAVEAAPSYEVVPGTAQHGGRVRESQPQRPAAHRRQGRVAL